MEEKTMKERLQEEYDELRTRYDRFCRSMDELPYTAAEWALLEKQRRAMNEYLTVLGQRLSLA